MQKRGAVSRVTGMRDKEPATRSLTLVGEALTQTAPSFIEINLYDDWWGCQWDRQSLWQDYIEDMTLMMTTYTFNVVFIVVWPIFNIILVSA